MGQEEPGLTSGCGEASRTTEAVDLAYEAFELPRRPGEGHFVADLDERGRVLVNHGRAFDDSEAPPGAFLWDGSRHELEAPWTLIGAWASVSAMNDQGLIVGAARGNHLEEPIPLVWHPGSNVASILDVPGMTGEAVAVNEAGQILVSSMRHGEPHAYLLSGGAWLDLGPGEPRRLNDRGDVLLVLFERLDGGWRRRLVLWDAGVRTELPFSAAANDVYANGFNNRGEVAAAEGGGGLPSQAVLYREGERITLSPLVEGFSAASFAINDATDVVGWSETPETPLRATLWRAGCPIDVSPPDAELSIARAISDSGRVLADSDLGGYLWQDGIRAWIPGPGSPSYINRRDVIAGMASSEHGYDSRVLIWRPGTGVITQNSSAPPIP